MSASGTKRTSRRLNVCFWHLADIQFAPTKVRFRG
jgi:hypothetical protein